jgi:hypothetical protein
VIDGRGTAVIDGSRVSPSSEIAPEFDGLIFIEGTTNVTLTGLTVRNSPVNGIRAARGSSVLLRDVTARDNAMAGIEIVDNSAAEAIDVTTRSNAWGFDVLMNSVLVMKRTFTTADNSRNGLVIHEGSVAENRGAHVTASNNQLFGVVVGTGSHLAHLQWEAAVGSTLTVSGSGAADIFLADSSLSTTGDMVITASRNGVGILAVAGSNIASPNGSATFILKDNGVGLNLASGSRATFVGGLEVNGNQAGILADGAAVHVEAAGGCRRQSSVTGST